jgi:PIN domain nuclease of toxin-antitoxin system
MNLLVDTHLLLWSTADPQKLSSDAAALLEDPSHALFFSAASMWEIAIKRSKGHADFQIDPSILRKRLLQLGYQELLVSSEQAFAVSGLPWLHKDPFDRLLLAQAMVESLTLLTGDKKLFQYSGPIQRV